MKAKIQNIINNYNFIVNYTVQLGLFLITFTSLVILHMKLYPLRNTGLLIVCVLAFTSGFLSRFIYDMFLRNLFQNRIKVSPAPATDIPITDEKPYQFPLRNVALYAKNHYKRTDNIWADMCLCLAADGYSEWEPKWKQDIALIISTKVEKLMREFRREELFRNISPNECWRVGYRTKGNRFAKDSDTLPEYDYWEAVLRAYLSELSNMTCTELGYENWDLFKVCIPELEKYPELKTN